MLNRIFPLFLTLACSPIFEGEPELQELYRMRIPNSSKVIYDYYYEGPMTFSTPSTGATILDSTETFSRSKIDEFPSEYNFTIQNKVIHTIDLVTPEPHQDTTLKPVREYQLEQQGIQIKVKQFQNLGGYSVSGCGGQKYFFDFFKETPNSIYFFGVEREFGKLKPDTCGYLKGKIKLIETDQGMVQRVEVKELVNGLRDTYRPEKPTTKVPNQPVICIAQVSFIPKDSLKGNDFSDYGIFKKVKTVANN